MVWLEGFVLDTFAFPVVELLDLELFFTVEDLVPELWKSRWDNEGCSAITHPSHSKGG
jgi:hypothetical protein